MAAAALMLLTAAGCKSDSANSAGVGDRAAAAQASAHRVRYDLDWSWEGAERDPSGSWSTVNDLGYRVHVTRGYIVSYSMELVECPKEAVAPLARAGSALLSILEGTAYAGHSSGTPNPAAIRAIQVESLTAPRVAEAGTVTLSPQEYCQLHYLVARAPREAQGLPSEVDMVDASVDIEGTYRAPGAEAQVPFTVHTAAAYGAMFDRGSGAESALRVDTGASATQVVVRRRPARMFDGVDFASMRPPVVASRILESLIASVEIDVRSEHEAS